MTSLRGELGLYRHLVAVQATQLDFSMIMVCMKSNRLGSPSRMLPGRDDLRRLNTLPVSLLWELRLSRRSILATFLGLVETPLGG
jgi:hypothetical protein